MCYNYSRQVFNKEVICMIKKIFVLVALFGLAGAYIKQCSKKTYCTVGADNNEDC